MKKFKSILAVLVDKVKNLPKRFKKKEKPLLIDCKDEIDASAAIVEAKIDDQIAPPDLKIKFKKARLPRIFISHKKGSVSTAMMVILPLAVAITGATIGIIASNNKKTTQVVEIVTNKDAHRVYLLANDNYVVPVTVKLEKKLTMQEEILDVFNLLKVDTKLKSDYFRGYIPVDASMKKIELDNGELALDFSEEFLGYEEKSELRMLESLAHTFLEFKGVNYVNFLVEGEPLKNMPKYNTPVNDYYNREFGINKSLTQAGDSNDKEQIVMYYQKTYDAKYYVPVTISANRGDNKVETFYNGLDLKPSLITGLKAIDEYKLIKKDVSPIVKNSKIDITVNQEALLDEVSIKREVFEMIKLTFDFANLTDTVNLLIDGEAYMVDGYYAQDSVEVSSIIYNSVAI